MYGSKHKGGGRHTKKGTASRKGKTRMHVKHRGGKLRSPMRG